MAGDTLPDKINIEGTSKVPTWQLVHLLDRSERLKELENQVLYETTQEDVIKRVFDAVIHGLNGSIGNNIKFVGTIQADLTKPFRIVATINNSIDASTVSVHIINN